MPRVAELATRGLKFLYVHNRTDKNGQICSVINYHINKRTVENNLIFSVTHKSLSHKRGRYGGSLCTNLVNRYFCFLNRFAYI